MYPALLYQSSMRILNIWFWFTTAAVFVVKNLVVKWIISSRPVIIWDIRILGFLKLSDLFSISSVFLVLI